MEEQSVGHETLAQKPVRPCMVGLEGEPELHIHMYGAVELHLI